MRLTSIVLALVALLALPVAEASAARAKFRPSATAYTVGEGDGNATITVRKTKGGSGTITYSTSPGTATPDVDYTPVSGSLTFSGNETEKTFTIPILDDSVTEANETVQINLKPGKGVVIGNPKTRLTIVDNDGAARISFQSAAEQVSEQAGTHAVSVLRSGDTASAVSANFSVTGGTANGSDYSLASSSPVQFAPGETAKAISVAITDDNDVEGNETLQLGLSGVSANATLQAPTSTILTLLDDDVPSIVSFDSGQSWTASEADGVLLVTLTRTGSLASEASVEVTTTDGTAVAGSDYEAPSSEPVEFEAGFATATFAIGVTDDSADEPHEQFGVTVGNPISAAFAGGVASISATATIADNDGAPTVVVGDPTTGDGSGGAGTTDVTFTVVLSNPSTEDVTVDYEIRDASGNVVDSGTVTIPAGQTTVTVTRTVTGDGPFSVSISNPTGGGSTVAPGGGQTTTPGVSVGDVSAGGSGSGSGGSGTTDVTFVVEVSNPGNQDVDVDYTIRDGDGNVVGTGTVTVPAGQSSVTVTVPVTGEGPFTVTITDPTGGAAVTPGGGSGTNPTVGVGDVTTTNPGSGGAGTTDVTFDVEVENPGDEDVTVDYEIVDGNGNTVGSGTVTVPAGQGSTTVTVPVTGEGPFTVVISNPTGGASVTPGGGSSTSTGPVSTGDSNGGDAGGSTGGDTAAGASTVTNVTNVTNSTNTGSTSPLASQAGLLVLGERLGGCKLSVATFRSQRILRMRLVRVKLHAVEACTGSVKSHVKGRKSLRGIKKGAVQTKLVRFSLKAGQSKTIKMRFSKRGYRFLKRALGKQKRLNASLLVRSVNPAKRVTLSTLRFKAKR